MTLSQERKDKIWSILKYANNLARDLALKTPIHVCVVGMNGITCCSIAESRSKEDFKGKILIDHGTHPWIQRVPVQFMIIDASERAYTGIAQGRAGFGAYAVRDLPKNARLIARLTKIGGQKELKAGTRATLERKVKRLKRAEKAS